MGWRELKDLPTQEGSIVLLCAEEEVNAVVAQLCEGMWFDVGDENLLRPLFMSNFTRWCHVHAADEVEELRDQLRKISELAHDKSTGPAVPDVYWEIRALAIELL